MNHEVMERCRQLGLDDDAPDLIRRFIEAAFYHAYQPGLPEPPLADRHVAICSGLRNVTVRIACQWRQPGRAKDHCRNLSASAVKLRDDLLTNADLTIQRKYTAWSSDITIEHHDPIKQIWEWIEKTRPDVDAVVERALKYPIAIITRDEDKGLNRLGYRTSGAADDRYKAAKIELLWQDKGTLDFFFEQAGRARRKRRSKYDPVPSASGILGSS